MKTEIKNIPKEFKIIQNESSEKLIIPEFGVGNDCWQDFNLRWLRSLHIDKNDKTISCGFPKFMNMGEGCFKFNVNESDLLNKKDLIATLKIDGSLLIRYVNNGRVKWRTRGSLEVGLDNKDEIGYFLQKYPKLRDPNYCPDISILFEWVSPKNQIVIKYDAPEIYIVGAVEYNRNVKWYESDFNLLSIKNLQKISQDTGVCMVQHFYIKKEKEVIDLINTLKTNKEIEGWVIRFNNEQELVKLKTDHYFILHALKSKLTTESLIDLYLSFNKPSFKEFENKFINTYDYETFKYALPAISSMYDGIKVTNRILLHIEIFVLEFQNEFLEGKTRKDFALLAKQKYQNEKLACCFKLLDGKPIDDKLYKKILLQNTKQYDLSIFSKNNSKD